MKYIYLTFTLLFTACSGVPCPPPATYGPDGFRSYENYIAAEALALWLAEFDQFPENNTCEANALRFHVASTREMLEVGVCPPGTCPDGPGGTLAFYNRSAQTIYIWVHAGFIDNWESIVAHETLHYAKDCSDARNFNLFPDEGKHDDIRRFTCEAPPSKVCNGKHSIEARIREKYRKPLDP